MVNLRTLLPLLLVSTTLVGSHLSCKKTPTEPPNGGGPDTTSHDFQFQTFVLGDGNASVLYDVQVIDDNNIWAVGEVFFRDSAGQYSQPAFNIARWNGTQWSFQRLLFPQYNDDCSIAFHGGPSIKAVFVFGPGNVLLTDGGSIARWNGSAFVHYPCMPRALRNGTIRRIWGTSENQFYVVGLNGTIVRYNNGNWQKLESGTDLHVADIWGGSVNGQTEILAVASRSTGGADRKLMRIEGNTVQSISDSGIGRVPLTGLWFSPGRKYYVVGSGIYRKNLLTDQRWIGAPLELTEFYSGDVDGNDTNDVVVAGAFGDLLHYNGSTWRQYPEIQFNGGFMSVDIHGNTVAAVGYLSNQRAVAVIGRRH